MPRPFEVSSDYLRDNIDEMVSATFSDLQSEFLVLPRGTNFVEYGDFRDAYEVLKRHTSAFADFREETIWLALREDALSFLVLRTMLGITPPEWANLANTERGSDIDQGYARKLNSDCRADHTLFSRLTRPRDAKRLDRAEAMVSVAIDYVTRGSPAGAADTVHRLAKVDTTEGLTSLQYAAVQDVPYAMLLYERYLGRPFASHMDSVSELRGEVMESAIEERLSRAKVSFRKTKRAERVPGYEQAPDFFVPDEFHPAVLIEAKIASDDGTARDKIARIRALAEMRDNRTRAGQPSFQVVACIDGRGFGVRREGIGELLIRMEGKVFTLATLDQLIPHTRIHKFISS